MLDLICTWLEKTRRFCRQVNKKISSCFWTASTCVQRSSLGWCSRLTYMETVDWIHVTSGAGVFFFFFFFFLHPKVFTLHIASTLYLPNSLWFLQKYVKLDQKSWKSAQTSRRVNPMAASFHALYLLPQLNSACSSRHNIFCRVEWAKQSRWRCKRGRGAKRKRSTETHE